MQHRSWWSEAVSTDEAHARAAARRRWNSVRQARAAVRRGQIAEMLTGVGFLVPGMQARIAATLGVSRATISRDVQAILRGVPAPMCPCCGALRAQALDRLDELLEDSK